MFNIREVCKQCLLLEDHLNNSKKRCQDCIRKHFLTIDGFLEEAISLESDLKKRDELRRLHIRWIGLEKEYVQNPNSIDELAKKLRQFRKPLVGKCFDMVLKYDV
jgi:hypothetical protein